MRFCRGADPWGLLFFFFFLFLFFLFFPFLSCLWLFRASPWWGGLS
nr:hypothetical protein [Escherichia coli]